MSDLRLLNLKSKESFSKIKTNKINMQKMVEENCEDFLGLKLVASNYQIQSHQQEVIETIAIDENYQLTIIEYRQGKFGQTINKGLFYLDYIKRNLSEFKLLVKDQLGLEVANQVHYHPRLICIGDDFNRYDEYAISQLRLDIELIKVQTYTKGYVVLEKAFQGIKQIQTKGQGFNLPPQMKELFNVISQFTLALGDEVLESDFQTFIAYRRIKNFMYVIYEDELIIQLKIQGSYRSYSIKTQGDFNRLKANIESAYDQN